MRLDLLPLSNKNTINIKTILRLKYIIQIPRTTIYLLIFILTISTSLFAQRTNPFLSITGNRGFPEIKQAIPYNKGVGQFDFIDSTDALINQVDSVYAFSLYFDLKDSLQELAFRIISPLPFNFSPNKGDRVSYRFDNSDLNKQVGFEAFLQLSRLVVSQQDSTWVRLKDETPARLKEYSMEAIRITDKNGLSKIPPGVYQLLIKTKLPKRPHGYYAIQFGAIPSIAFPALEKTIESIK